MGLCRPLIPSASVRGFSLPGNAKVGSPESRSGPDWATNRGQHKLGPGKNFSAPRGIATLRRNHGRRACSYHQPAWKGRLLRLDTHCCL